MLQTHPRQVVFGAVRSVVIEMGNLSELLGQIAPKMEAKSASAGTLRKNGCFHITKSPFARGLLQIQLSIIIEARSHSNATFLYPAGGTNSLAGIDF